MTVCAEQGLLVVIDTKPSTYLQIQSYLALSIHTLYNYPP